MNIIPAIDLLRGRCVRLVQGRRDSSVIYDDDPVAVARRFADEGARMLHVVDLDGAFSEDNAPNRKVLHEITSAVEIPVQFGGGLRTAEDVSQALEAGAQWVVLGTVAAESPGLLNCLLDRFGSPSIVVGIDANRERVAVRGWEGQLELAPLTLARRVAAAGVERIVYTDIERDGMLTGPSIGRTIAVARASGLRVTGSGGISGLDDLLEFKAAEPFGVDSVIVGKALYERRFTLREALAAIEKP